jgi:hypothetical protein
MRKQMEQLLRRAHAGSKMPAVCSLPGNAALADSTGLDSTVKA